MIDMQITTAIAPQSNSFVYQVSRVTLSKLLCSDVAALPHKCMSAPFGSPSLQPLHALNISHRNYGFVFVSCLILLAALAFYRPWIPGWLPSFSKPIERLVPVLVYFTRCYALLLYCGCFGWLQRRYLCLVDSTLRALLTTPLSDREGLIVTLPLCSDQRCLDAGPPFCCVCDELSD